MSRIRLRFEKTGRAKYISHLDLLRTYQRVFLRAGLKLRHTEGFNPHPYISFALPLPLGTESVCELLDFDLAESIDNADIPQRLNEKMPEGIRVTAAYAAETKFSTIAFVEAVGSFDYDRGLPDGIILELTKLFQQDSIVIQKKTKKGPINFDIIPWVKTVEFSAMDATSLSVHTVASAQNPTINPEYIASAVREYLPLLAPDFATFRRMEVYDQDLKVFR